MEPQILLRAAPPFLLSSHCTRQLARSCSIPTTIASTLLCQHQRRTKLTTSRTKRALNIPPHPSFLVGAEDAHEDVIIFNPPSSEISVYHTPFKFLPKNDPRRRANVASLFSSSTTIKYPTEGSSTDQVSPSIPKFEHKPLQDVYNVSQADVAEMRRLRALDPVKWSVAELAEKFNTSKAFVMMAAGSKTISPHRKAMEAEQDKVKSRWGAIRAKAREDRRKRREMLYRGEL